MTQRMTFSELRDFYRDHLANDVMSFWTTHALDHECGGINTCIRDDGAIVSHDKYLWSQWRAVWVFSTLYQRFEPRPEWRQAAEGIYRFVAKHGRDDDGRTVFCLDRSGAIKEGYTSIYADAFALSGLTEYFRMTGDPRAERLAREIFPLVKADLDRPGTYPTDPHRIPPGFRAHGPSMIFSLVFYELGTLLNDSTIRQAGLDLTRDVFDHFLRPEDGLLHEFIRLDNTLDESPECRVIVPGHVIEDMWFQIHILQRQRDESGVRRACELIEPHLALGWDAERGGIYHAVDTGGSTAAVAWKFADTKLWWPATEALYALLLAYEKTSATWCLPWYWKVHDYAFTHYPDREHGEWRQRLDVDGKPLTKTVALPVKDPFHLPRALLLCTEVLDRLSRGEQGGQRFP
ncbi:MAG: AGE family epimerase/isomerase [Phycisphaerae bacterium]|nr:AGE family epimerase/isomerase [Phycisphaerae bacterium]